jgi:hypothetical protein
VLVGITGHQNLSPHCIPLVRAEIDRALSRLQEPVIGLTSLAAGADQIFAEAVLRTGGQISVVLPSDKTESSFSDETALARFTDLLGRASETTQLPFAEPGEKAYWAAGQTIADRCELLFAVWDGKQAGGLGGTADVVGYARGRGKNVTVIWPPGCARR